MSQHNHEAQAESPIPHGKRIALVLGSGGARGLAHIGVIRELQARGYHIETISGCSMGALVAGLYAAGKLEAYTEWALTLNKYDIFKLLDVGGGSGLIAGNKIMAKLEEWIADIQIEDLPIPYSAVAVDIEREREVWFNEGPLCDAIRASIAIPGVFTPHVYRNRVLVDGSVLNPIPVAPTFNRITDATFVVDANGPPVGVRPGEPVDTEHEHRPGWFAQAAAKIGWNYEPQEAPPEPEKMGVWRVMERSLDTMMAALTRHHLAVFQPDMVFRVPRNLYMIHEYHRAEEIIALGQNLARELFDNPELERNQKM